MTSVMDNHQIKGEIYMITNTKTNKSYIGQAPQYITSNKQKWGAKGRWVRHIYESKHVKNGKDCEFHTAIREYGEDAFNVSVLCECNIEEMDQLEEDYIMKYNTLSPNGYNMTTGGKRGKHSDSSNIKKSLNKIQKKLPQIENGEPSKKKIIKKLNTMELRNTEEMQTEQNSVITKNSKEDKSEETFKSILKQVRQKRKNGKARKNELDKSLPKYLSAIRKDDKIVGYMIKKFPVGVENTCYVNKSFRNENHPDIALKEAEEYLQDLEKQYTENLERYNSKQRENEKIRLASNKIYVPKLPPNVYPVINDNLDFISGYYVDGLFAYDNSPIPRRYFTEHTNTNNIDKCVRFIDTVNKYNEHKMKPSDWLNVDVFNRETDDSLPNHIRKTYYNGSHTGYRVDFFLRYDENGKQIVETKCFTKKKLSMDYKLKMAIDHVDHLTKKFKTTTTNTGS